jgi:hypothetical protein
MVRRNNILLYGAGNQRSKRFTGIECFFYKRRTTGPFCPSCYDLKKRQSVRSNCEDCYKTGRFRGYHTPIPVNFQIDPHGQAVDHANISEQQPTRTRAWTSNYPELSPGDVIVEPGNRRWRVQGVSTTEQHRIIVRQMVELYYITPGAVEYRLELPDEC